MIKLLVYDFLSILFPKLCPGCKNALGYGEKIICTHCISNWATLKSSGYVNQIMIEQLWGRVNVNSAYSFMRYQKESLSQNILKAIKYENNPVLAVDLGKLFGQEMKDHWQEYDLIVPVPLHIRKERKRGYNQSERISFGISQVINIPVVSNNLKRGSNTESQTQKSRIERLINIRNVFTVLNPELFKEKRILLVDDVFTTGATIEACGEQLIASGAQYITPVTLATG